MDAQWRRNGIAVAYALLAPAAVTAILVPLRASLRPAIGALVLVAVVIAIAASGFRIAGLIAGLSAAFWLDFFLIPPYQSLTGTGAENYETVFLLLAVGAAVSELAVRGRRQRTRAGLARRDLDLLYGASVTIGTTLDMTRTAEELVQIAVPGFADYATVDLTSAVLGGEEPREGNSTELRRVASGGIRRDAPLRPVGTVMTLVPDVAEESRFFGGPRSRIQPDLRAAAAWRVSVPESAAVGAGLRLPLADHLPAADPRRPDRHSQLLALAAGAALPAGRPGRGDGSGPEGGHRHRQRAPLHAGAGDRPYPAAQPAAAVPERAAGRGGRLALPAR